MSKKFTGPQGEHSPVVVKYEPLRYNGISIQSTLIAHSYRKYVRSNPSAASQVSGHGGTSKYAQWRLHAINKNKFKLQNIQTGKYLRIVDSGNTVDVNGTGGKFTVFKAVQQPSTNKMVQPHMISLESEVFPNCFIAVNGNCNVYSYNANTSKSNKNDIHLYLYARPQPPQSPQSQPAQANVLKPGVVVIQHEFGKHVRVQPGNEQNANGMVYITQHTVISFCGLKYLPISTETNHRDYSLMTLCA